MTLLCFGSNCAEGMNIIPFPLKGSNQSGCFGTIRLDHYFSGRQTTTHLLSNAPIFSSSADNAILAALCEASVDATPE
jgi:hypothetical protein